MKKSIYVLLVFCVFFLLGACTKETGNDVLFTTSTTTSQSVDSQTNTTQATISTTAETTLKPSTTIIITNEITSEPEETSGRTDVFNSMREHFSGLIDIDNPLDRVTFRSEKPTLSDGSPDFSYFDNCAFLGNSRIMDFGPYGYAKNVYGAVGLTVDTVFTKSSGSGKGAVINELNGKHFDKIFLYFGDNESGWASLNTFADHYKEVIDAVKLRCPGARIYLLSVMPISRSASDENNYGYNMTGIEKANDVIKDLAKQEGLDYLNCTPSVKNAAGYLPEDAAPDGIHMKKKYICKWATFIYNNV